MGDSQLNLFIPIVGEAATKDQQDMMSYPCFSLSKRKRTEPITFKSKDNWIKVVPSQEHGMAQIWDLDILIYCASLLKHMQKHGLDITFPLKVRGNDLLAFVGRPTNDKGYEGLRAALKRLMGTKITTNIRVEDVRGEHHEFYWVSEWKEYYRIITDSKTKKDKRISDGFEIDLPKWFVNGVLDDRLVLSISNEYFDITGGIQRFLYRLCRKHCGKQAEWRISIRGLYQRSASTSRYKEFKRMLKKAVEAGIPQYDLVLANIEGTDMLHVCPSNHGVLYDTDNVIAYSKPKGV